MLKSAVAATDLSQEALAVVKNMENLKCFGLEKCLLLQASIEGGGDSPTESNITTIEMVLQAKRQILEEAGIKAETRVVKSLSAAEISRISDEENYPLIVVGAKARNLISEALLGETAYNIIHNCRKPIFVMRLQDTEQDGLTVPVAARGDYTRHILFPTDFSETADQAFEVLKGLVTKNVEKVTLMHVQDQTLLSPYLIARLSEFNETDAERLNEMKKTLASAADVEIDTLITYGNPSRDILKTIKDLDVRLVVMGSQGKGFAHDFFIGSVGHNIARQSESSVLLIPAAVMD